MAEPNDKRDKDDLDQIDFGPEFEKLYQQAEELGDDGMIGTQIEEAPWDKQVQLGLGLIDMGLGLLVAKNIMKFNGSNREEIIEKLIDTFKEVKT
jgi:hypothetical protein